jgi:hypothetical protein
MAKRDVLAGLLLAAFVSTGVAHADLIPLSKTPGGWDLAYGKMEDGSALCEAIASY